MKYTDKAIEILQAKKEGKIIEIWEPCVWKEFIGDEIALIKTIADTLGKDYLRIKPQPIYYSYTNAEEFLEASKKHGGWFRKWNNRELLFTPYYIDNIAGAIYFRNNKLDCWAHYKDLCNDYVWVDDSTPCGILKQ